MKKIAGKATIMTGAAALVTGIGALAITLINKKRKEKSIEEVTTEQFNETEE